MTNSKESSVPSPVEDAELERRLDAFDIAAQQLGQEWPPTTKSLNERNAAREAVRFYLSADKRREALRLAAIRLGILADRMEGCNADAIENGTEPVHGLLDEARMFEEEARAAAGLSVRDSAMQERES